MPFKQDVLERIRKCDPSLTSIERGAWTGLLTNDDIRTITDIINDSENTVVTDLNLSENSIGDEGALALSSLKTLKSLQLADNEITDRGAIGLAKSNSLSFLDISANAISEKGFLALLGNANIQKLFILGCNFTNGIVDSIFENKTLQTLLLDEGNISEDVFRKIVNHINSNKSSALSSASPLKNPFWSNDSAPRSKKLTQDASVVSEHLLNIYSIQVKALFELLQIMPLENRQQCQHELLEMLKQFGTVRTPVVFK